MGPILCRTRITGLKALVTGGVLLALFFSTPFSLHAATQWIEVKKVIDGDTLLLKDRRKIRLIGIDTPELHESEKLERDAEESHRSRKTIKKLGKRAKDVAVKLLGKGPVRLEFGDELHDRHGRTLAYVYFKSTPRKLTKALKLSGEKTASDLSEEYMLNRVMVQYGYANAFTKFPFKYSREFTALERQAREQERGLWKPSSR